MQKHNKNKKEQRKNKPQIEQRVERVVCPICGSDMRVTLSREHYGCLDCGHTYDRPVMVVVG